MLSARRRLGARAGARAGRASAVGPVALGVREDLAARPPRRRGARPRGRGRSGRPRRRGSCSSIWRAVRSASSQSPASRAVRATDSSTKSACIHASGPGSARSRLADVHRAARGRLRPRRCGAATSPSPVQVGQKRAARRPRPGLHLVRCLGEPARPRPAPRRAGPRRAPPAPAPRGPWRAPRRSARPRAPGRPRAPPSSLPRREQEAWPLLLVEGRASKGGGSANERRISVSASRIWPWCW